MSALLSGRGKLELPFELLSFALEPSDRAVLHRRIATRFDAMLGTRDDTGLVAEVAALRARGDLHPNLPSMRCVGYRQAWDYLDGAIDRASPARDRHHRHPPAGQAPAHLAARHAGADRARLPRPRPARQLMLAQIAAHPASPA